MKNLIIIGARAMGRETYTYARESGYDVKGFLDDNSHCLDDFCDYPPILGTVEDYEIAVGDVFVVALGEPVYRRRYVDFVVAKGGTFVSIIHPSAYIGKNVVIGHGCIICPHSTITNDVNIGDHVVVNINATISHDNRIGNFSTISPGAHLAGRVSVGENVFIGVGATLIPDVVLGKNTVVAAGAVVTKSFDSGLLIGIPARRK